MQSRKPNTVYLKSINTHYCYCFFFRKDKETRQEGNDKLLFLYENNYVKQLFKTKNFRGDCYDPTSIRLLKKKKCLYNLNLSNKKNKAICNHVRLVTRI